MIGIKKLFEFRNESASKRGMWGDDQEKPFLDHLEDLRWMLLKVIITLLIAVVGCFAFHQQLFDVVLQPLRKAAEFESEVLPKRIDEPRWERVKQWRQTLASLPEEQQRQVFLAEIAELDRKFLEQRKQNYLSWGKDPEEPVAFESLMRIAGAYYAASVLYHEAGAKQKRKNIQPPEDFFARILSAEEVAIAVELWKKGVSAEASATSTKLRMFALAPPEAFLISMKMSLYAAIVVSFPVLLFFLAEFILPGITQRERKVLYRALFVGFGLFITGVLFAFFIVVPRAINFFQGWGDNLGLSDEWSVGKYVPFVTQMTLIFGLCFELPVVVLSLLKLGLVSVKMLREGRIWGYGIILISAALITPTTDALTLGLLAGPMIILYEITILIGAAMERKERKQAVAEEARYQARLVQPALATTATAAGEVSDGSEVVLPSDSDSSSVKGRGSAANSEIPELKPRTDIHAHNTDLGNSGEQIADEPELESEADEADEQSDPWLDDPWSSEEETRNSPSAWSEDFRPEEEPDEEGLPDDGEAEEERS